ncbi:MAG: hypothetical protein KDI75_06045 [Xanthomonadales bacterium]|nr:hypothetical protein [Xanthomonadales bacterium]
MSNASSNWLELPLTPPRWLIPALLVLVVLAMLAIGISDLHWRFVAIPLLILPVLLMRLSRWPTGQLHFRDDGSLWWIDGERGEHALSLTGIATRGPLQVLRMVDAGGQRLVAMFCRPGNLDAAQQRRLTLWLRRFANIVTQSDDTAVTP